MTFAKPMLVKNDEDELSPGDVPTICDGCNW